MCWDVLLMNVPDSIKSPGDIPAEFKSSLGMSTDVLSTLSSHVPEINLDDPTWGTLRGDGFSIESSIRNRDTIEVIMLHVRGGEGAIKVIEHICSNTDWRAIDFTTGEFIDFNHNPEKGLRQWRKYRDQVIKS